MVKNENGFTLIELLIVVAIISILAAIGISHYSNYKIASHNATAKADLRNGIAHQEGYYVENTAYLTCASAAACEANLTNFTASKDNTGTPVVTTFTFTAAGQTFTGQAIHQFGDVTFDFDSAVGTITES